MRLSPDPQFGSEVELIGFFGDMSRDSWINHIAYLDFSSAPDTTGPYAVTTYPAAWVDHYVDSDYFALDPVVGTGLNRVLPFDWQSARTPSCRKIRDFFGEAAEFGVARQGLSLPIRGTDNECALLSINSDLPHKDWTHITTACVGELFLFAHRVHLAVRQWRGVKPHPARGTLSPRERDVLAWAAEGKTNWETAQILNLSEPTVAFYVRKAMAKLCSANKTHAVALALRNNLL